METCSIPPCDASLKIERADALPGKARFVTRSQTLWFTKRTTRGDEWRSIACSRFESATRPAVCPVPRPQKDVNQNRYQDRQQIVEVELKCRIKPLKIDELIKQGHPLFIDEFLGSEARYDYSEVGNRAQYVEKHLSPP